MLNLERLTLKAIIENSANKYADRPALSFVDGEPITYAELHQKIKDVARFLQDQEISAGDRVAILSENSPNWGIAYLATAYIGAVVVPILPDFHPNEVHHILRHSASKAIFVSERLYEKIELEKFDALKCTILTNNFSLIPPATKKETLKALVKEQSKKLVNITRDLNLPPIAGQKKVKEFLLKGTDELEKLISDLSITPSDYGMDKVRELLQKGTKELERLKGNASRMYKRITPEVDEDDLGSIIYTSGTTGHSKGVMLTNKNIVSNVVAGVKIINFATEEDKMLSILPMSHTYECSLGFLVPLAKGMAVYYLEKPPTPRVLLPAMEKIRPTLMLSIPLVIEKIFKLKIQPQLNSSALLRGARSIPALRKIINKKACDKLYQSFGGKLKFFGIGGAPLNPEVEAFLREGGFPYAIGYGLTEMSPLVAGSAASGTKYRSTGPVIPNGEMRIDNPDPNTGEGEIHARGSHVMKGYYKDPERTREVMTKDGWFKTGDLGLIDKDGYLFIKGRLKNMILGPSGENIYPEEIEAIIMENDYVAETIVYEQEGQLTGKVHFNQEKLDILFLPQNLTQDQIREKITQMLEEIRKEVNSKVSSFSRIQKMVEQVDPFAKTPTKKIKRFLYVK